ncbi:MAG: ImmA/IrrE family metallo-endopeptidase [Bacilli bacterium]|jgi:Zn-dependent peptidase ImmA (M78 family)|nr:ImmA/IrrE family metallo-endopeptidase [Bacilli bacterium]
MLKLLIQGVLDQQEVLNYYNANVTYTELPNQINGFVFNYKGINNIYINKELTYYKRKKTLLHELAHIKLNQLCQSDKDLFAFHIQEYEDEADRYIKQILEEIKKEV